MDEPTIITALRRTGELLEQQGAPPTRIVVIGGAAAILSHFLGPSRVTIDCDVIAVDPDSNWDGVVAAASDVGSEMGIGADWLNRKATVFGWTLPLGWRQRITTYHSYGRLVVQIIGRFDLLALKLIGAGKRRQDREDLRGMAPTAVEFDALREHLDRLEAEDLDRQSYDRYRAILDRLEAEP